MRCHASLVPATGAVPSDGHTKRDEESCCDRLPCRGFIVTLRSRMDAKVATPTSLKCRWGLDVVFTKGTTFCRLTYFLCFLATRLSSQSSIFHQANLEAHSRRQRRRAAPPGIQDDHDRDPRQQLRHRRLRAERHHETGHPAAPAGSSAQCRRPRKDRPSPRRARPGSRPAPTLRRTHQRWRRTHRAPFSPA